MPDRLERFIQAVYQRYKSDFPPSGAEHPQEEEMACFWEGRLSGEEEERIMAHLLGCQRCLDILTVQSRMQATQEKRVPGALIEFAQQLVKDKERIAALEIFLKVKERMLELLSTTGDVILGQELIPAPVLRSRQMKDFKDQVIILKEFSDLRIEVKIENRGANLLDLAIVIKDKLSLKAIKDLRVTLIKEGRELGSYLTERGSVVFEHVLLGRYAVEISDSDNKLASVILDIKV